MTEKLPGVLAEIAELIGEAGALAIAARRGGTRVYFPQKVPADHWLVACVGLKAAAMVSERFGGETCDIPLVIGGTYRQFIRAIAERIHELDGTGDSHAHEIAHRLGVTQRTVHRHRAHHRGGHRDKRQKDLF
ncbi:hypothetical protein [Nitrobacter winogradskyi]|uniref:DeoR/GlpR family transcriptional regulator of sugar metabolism n=2 Tax=Nitrobacter winogradskyi TaxID=913 RepID=A0ACC6AIJ6_NITWI|nr:hypothetical protein [Nitrobacter winogradskyi]MCP1998810.1 DeoR/GlpR family transcriptional regulator of sugar metabolism [Nitrobacter winogradskyi]GEC14268.1 hypothetical protein NWI01_01600 [Nitrobacter winogradskyi]